MTTVGELREIIASADDTDHVGIVMQSNPNYDKRPIAGMRRMDLEPEFHIFLSIEGRLIQMN
jgi:hypothetical protein